MIPKRRNIALLCLSVLFSEPKIPQSATARRAACRSYAFQCSSASRKFLNLTVGRPDASRTNLSVLFSEPKIPQSVSSGARSAPASDFQCSSASRKFLNPIPLSFGSLIRPTFSALQRAENSSIGYSEHSIAQAQKNFQCSSASRKFLNLYLPLNRIYP